ncbi:unnamed protein product [Tenebrio molitor]|nr:unnamed protein product [Tenebrio molitor]
MNTPRTSPGAKIALKLCRHRGAYGTTSDTTKERSPTIPPTIDSPKLITVTKDCHCLHKNLIKFGHPRYDLITRHGRTDVHREIRN